MYVRVNSWDDFENLLKAKGVKEVYYKINGTTRQISLKFTDGTTIYEHVTPRDAFEYECQLYIDPPLEIRKLTKPIEIENEIMGDSLIYLVGSQKVRGFNMWFIYSNFIVEAEEFIKKKLKDYLVIEGDIEFLS